MRYDSFSLRIEPSAEGSYAVSVQSPQGEGHAVFGAPRRGDLLGIEPGFETKGAEERRDLSPRLSVPEAPALGRGKELFRSLFTGEVASLFHASLGSLRGQQRGLRINISINPRRPELAPLQQLPWELLCRPETEDVLCLSRQTPVVRFLEAHRDRRPAIARPRRLRILAVAANPTDASPLAVAKERKNLEEAWKGQEKAVEIVFLEPGGLEELRRALLAAPFHILHFMGHGTFEEESSEGALVFQRSDGTGQRFEGRRLAQLLHGFESLRLVVLNACHTAEAVGTHGPNPFAGVASSLVMGGVPAVVAMSGPISDLAAVAFSRTFYQRLAAGDVIEAAVTEGRLAIQQVDSGDGAWAVPALFLRSPDGMLFAPRSTVWARRAALLAGLALALALIWLFGSGWLRERRAAQVMRLTNDGVGLLGLGRRVEARKAFRAALEIDPDNAAVLGNIVIVEMQLGDQEAALAHAQAAVKAAPQEAIHHYNLGNLLAREKRYEEALPSLQRAIQIDQEYSLAYNELGAVYLDLDRPADARKTLEAGLRHDPTLAKLYKNLARACLAENLPDEAIVHLEAALPLYSPADSMGKAEAAYWLASAQLAAGRSEKACAALRTFAVLDPQRLGSFAKNATLLASQQRCAPWP